MLAAFLVPMILMAQENNEAVSMGRQALIIVLASFISQLLRRKRPSDLFGMFNVRWLEELCAGGLIGSAMMLVPAFVLGIFGLISGLGQWPVQLITAAFFLLTHLNNPGMTGTVKVMASINIFLASILFGLACIRTRSLAMPLGLHWMADWMQGGILGFGVSGTEQLGLLKPVFGNALTLLTGGQFELEASPPGFVCVLIVLFILYKMKMTTINDKS